jgi:hypothetical protein
LVIAIAIHLNGALSLLYLLGKDAPSHIFFDLLSFGELGLRCLRGTTRALVLIVETAVGISWHETDDRRLKDASSTRAWVV